MTKNKKKASYVGIFVFFTGTRLPYYISFSTISARVVTNNKKIGLKVKNGVEMQDIYPTSLSIKLRIIPKATRFVESKKGSLKDIAWLLESC